MRISASTVWQLPQAEKIRSYEEVCAAVRRLRRAGVGCILAQGAFDVVHAGHVGYLREALQVASRTNIVVVGIENDASIRKNKGSRRPVNPAEDRLTVLSEFESVRLVFEYPDVPDYNNPADFIDRYRGLKPEAIAVAGFDPHLHLKKLQAAKAGTTIAPVYYQHVNSTTAMLKAVGFEE